MARVAQVVMRTHTITRSAVPAVRAVLSGRQQIQTDFRCLPALPGWLN